MNKCEFCHTIFGKKSALTYHQKTAKYCLNIRNITTVYTCPVCDKQLSEKRQFDKHTSKCVSFEKFKELEETNKQLVKEIEFLKRTNYSQNAQITELQNKLENVAIQGVKKSTTTTTNTINLQPLTKEWMDKQALLLTEEHLLQGVSGLAQFAVDNTEES